MVCYGISGVVNYEPHVLVCQPLLFFITHSWEKIVATEEKT